MDLSRKKIDFLGIPVDAISMDETVELIDQAVRDGRRVNHVVINAGKVVAMQQNSELRESVVTCDLINADGQSIVWAARFLGHSIPGRVAGIDLMQRLVGLAAARGWGCYFFGAREEVVTKVVEIYRGQYGEGVVAGFRNGYYTPGEEKAIAQQIADSGARLLFVAMPSPKKENFMFDHRKALENVLFNMGVGGSFDVVAGLTKRAPVWMQRTGLEWFYRFLQEPRRMWKRYLVGNLRFIFIILKARITGNRSAP